MIWLFNYAAYDSPGHASPWYAVAEFAKNNNCTIIGSDIPLWLKCTRMDFSMIKLKYPNISVVSFTNKEFKKQLETYDFKYSLSLNKYDELSLHYRTLKEKHE